MTMIILWVNASLLLYSSNMIPICIQHDWVYCLSWLSVSTSVMIEHMVINHDLMSWFNLINTIPWFDFINSILWFDLISIVPWFDLITLTWLLLPSPPVEGCGRLSQSYYGKYDWLWPEFTQNTQGQYVLIFRIVLVPLTPDSPVQRFIPNLIQYNYYITSVWRLL